MNPLAQRSRLMHLHIKKWAAEVTDKAAQQIGAVAKHADTNQDSYKKSLFVTDALHEVNRCAGRIRAFFYHESLPWSDGGGRLMPSRSFKGFSVRHKALVRDFEMAVERFLQGYEEAKDEAEAKKGDLYDASEYPHVLEVRQKFGIELTTLPFPDIGTDFRVEAPEGVIKELKQDMAESLERVNNKVNTEVVALILKRLTTMRKSLSSGKGFKKTIFEELEHALSFADNFGDVLPRKTQDLVAEAKKHILAVTPEQIRNSETLKTTIVHNIKEMFNVHSS